LTRLAKREDHKPKRYEMPILWHDRNLLKCHPFPVRKVTLQRRRAVFASGVSKCSNPERGRSICCIQKSRGPMWSCWSFVCKDSHSLDIGFTSQDMN
jgi:hypothetical protein